MHWHECYVHSDEERSEMDFPKQIVILQPDHFLNPEVPCCEDCEDRTHTQHVVEVSNDIISVMKSDIDTSVSQDYTRQSTDSEKQDKPDRKIGRRFILNYTIPHRGQPAEYFHSCWNCNNHCCCCEIHARVYVQSDSVHVVCSDNEPQKSDTDHCIHHRNVTEYTLVSHFAQHVANDTKPWKNQNVHFWVTKESEEMLKQDRIPTSSWCEEVCSKQSIAKQHRNRTSQYRQRKQQQICCYNHRPRI